MIQALAKRGKTVLLSSHLLADVEDVCDRVAIFYNGRIQAMGTINELLEERQRYRMTMPELSPAAMERILAVVRAEIGSEPTVDHPRRDLEQFFLEVVDKARKATVEASGVGASAAVSRNIWPARTKLEQFVDKACGPCEPVPETPAATTPASPAASTGGRSANSGASKRPR